MTKPPAYRQRRLVNIEKRNIELRQILEARGPGVPLKSWVAFETAEENARQARKGIATTDGERLVGSAWSLQAKFEHKFAKSGLKSTIGGWKTQHLYGAWMGDWHSKATEIARPLVPTERPLPRGTKSRIAETVAERLGQKFDTVRRVLRISGIYNNL